MSQKSHWHTATMYKYFYFKTEIKTKVDIVHAIAKQWPTPPSVPIEGQTAWEMKPQILLRSKQGWMELNMFF